MKLLARQRAKGAQAGFSLLEVVATSTIAAVIILASATAFSSNLITVERARKITSGALFLETVLEDIAAQQYDNLLALDGNQIIDGADLGSSNFAVDLVVFEVGIDRTQVEATLTDLTTGTEMGEVTSLRTEW